MQTQRSTGCPLPQVSAPASRVPGRQFALRVEFVSRLCWELVTILQLVHAQSRHLSGIHGHRNAHCHRSPCGHPSLAVLHRPCSDSNGSVPAHVMLPAAKESSLSSCQQTVLLCTGGALPDHSDIRDRAETLVPLMQARDSPQTLFLVSRHFKMGSHTAFSRVHNLDNGQQTVSW